MEKEELEEIISLQKIRIRLAEHERENAEEHARMLVDINRHSKEIIALERVTHTFRESLDSLRTEVMHQFGLFSHDSHEDNKKTRKALYYIAGFGAIFFVGYTSWMKFFS